MPLRDSAVLGGLFEVLEKSPQPYHVESPAIQRRRRLGVSLTLVIGTVLLAFALGSGPTSSAFYPLTISLAFVWVFGAALSGPLHLGRWGAGGPTDRRRVGLPIVYAAAAFAVFVVGDLLFQQNPTLSHQITEIISRADRGSKTLVIVVALINGIGEELFFRGALYSAFGRNRPALWSIVAYTVSTAFTGNIALVVAGAVMGTLFTLERRATRGVLASTITHVVWSVLMIALLPRP